MRPNNCDASRRNASSALASHAANIMATAPEIIAMRIVLSPGCRWERQVRIGERRRAHDYSLFAAGNNRLDLRGRPPGTLDFAVRFRKSRAFVEARQHELPVTE